MMNDEGARFGLKASFPGWDKRSMSDNFAGGINGTDVGKDFVGDLIFGGEGHKIINALFAGIGKG